MASAICARNGESSIFDGQDNLIPSGDRFPDAFIKGIENISGLDNTTQAVILPHNDTAVKATMYAITRLDLRTITGQGAVGADKR